MCQHGIVLILVSTFCYGLGLPVKDNTNQTQISFSNELLNLANSCENLFLAELIKSRIDYCNILEQFHSKKDYECLMFYEINKQLCSSFGRTEIDLKGSYASKMNVTQNILTICDDAKTWKSASLYKPVLDKLFNSRILCLQVCTIDEMVSEDSNFFCKYYKWGSGMISSLTSPITQPSSIIAPTNSEIKPEVKSEASVTTNNAVNPQNSNVEPHSKEKNQSEQTTKSETALKQDVHKDADLNEPSKATSALQKPETKENNNDKSAPISSKSELENPLEQPSLKSDLEKENQGKPVIENPKPKQSLDLDDDPDNELGNDLEPDDEPLLDQDTMDSEDMNADPKLDVEKSKENANIIKSPITSFNVDSVQREMVYPNSIQDTFVEEDDHFFPFFLTTIVLVVLLYILYHNKSKVTKVILGLIVEGRQSNRRRNSRGHAYRRLDTLEQAMSTNSTAPPSKIIY